MGNKWIDFVRAYATKNNITFGCALGDKNMLEEYRKQKDKPIAKKKKLVIVGDLDKERKETKPAEKPKTSAAQYALQNKYLTKEIKSFVDFSFDKDVLDEVADDIIDGLSYWEELLDRYDDGDINIKYVNKQQENTLEKEARILSRYARVMKDLAIERIGFLARKYDLLDKYDRYNLDYDVDRLDEIIKNIKGE
jgi:hypothetical protein